MPHLGWSMIFFSLNSFEARFLQINTELKGYIYKFSKIVKRIISKSKKANLLVKLNFLKKNLLYNKQY